MNPRFYRVINHDGQVVILNADHILSMIPLYSEKQFRQGFGKGVFVQFTAINRMAFMSFVPADFDLYPIVKEWGKLSDD